MEIMNWQEITMESETFSKIRESFNLLLQRLFQKMEQNHSDEGAMPCNPSFVYYKEKKGGKDRIVLTNGEVAVGTVQDYPEHATGFGYISHFATCEAAQMFRKKKKAAV